MQIFILNLFDKFLKNAVAKIKRAKSCKNYIVAKSPVGHGKHEFLSPAKEGSGFPTGSSRLSISSKAQSELGFLYIIESRE